MVLFTAGVSKIEHHYIVYMHLIGEFGLPILNTINLTTFLYFIHDITHIYGYLWITTLYETTLYLLLPPIS